MKPMQVLLSIAVACLLLLLLLGAIFVGQNRLLYFPERVALDRMLAGGLRAWPSSQGFRGLVAEPPGAPRGTAIVFHGNAGHAGHRGFYVQSLVPLGWRVILAEYPGYGPRAGRLGEDSLVADAASTLALAHRQYGTPLLVIGESLGAAVAAGAVHRQPDVATGLLLVTPWDRLAHVATFHYPWLPVSRLLRDDYASVQYLAGFDRPIVVVVAARDSIVPARFGAALRAASRAPGRLLVIESGDHNDWPNHVDTAWWRDAIALATGSAR